MRAHVTEVELRKSRERTGASRLSKKEKTRIRKYLRLIGFPCYDVFVSDGLFKNLMVLILRNKKNKT